MQVLFLYLKKLHYFTREQLQKVNQTIVGNLIQRRAQDHKLGFSERPTIIFSPHQDDEVLGCGGMIIHKQRLGGKIYIVFMTDGRASHKSGFIAPAELAALRNAEARECAKAMGVPEENLIFLKFEDGCLTQHEAEAQKRISHILQHLLPAEVFVPFRREAPADHNATYRIVRNALEEIARQALPAIAFYEYLVWTPRLWFWKIHEFYQSNKWFRIDVRQVQTLKQRALACYRSQTTALYPDPKWSTLPNDLLTWCGQPHEYYFKEGEYAMC
jgi:LmbE family N-acetylglucosaminyl deacetylase